MRKTYKCSNVKFCMEDENQRRTWEHLQTMTRKDGSYGKVLSDAFVAALDGAVQSADCSNSKESADGLKETLERMLDKKIQDMRLEMQKFFAEQIDRCFKQYDSDAPASASRPADDVEMDEMEQGKTEELSEEMMDFAFAMGE